MVSVDLLLLDVNGVLYDYDPDVRVQAMAKRLGVEPGTVRGALFEQGIEGLSDSGEISPQTYLARVGDAVGASLDRDTWAASLAAAVSPRPGALALVESLTSIVRCATLSNNGLLVRDRAEQVFPELAALDVEIHVAAEFGESKPDRDVYSDACAVLGSVPQRTAFVDDNEANAIGAIGAGLRAHHYVDTPGFAKFLRDLGLDPS